MIHGIDELINKGDLKGSIISYANLVRLNEVRQRAATQLRNINNRQRKAIENAVTGNAGFADISINRGSVFTLSGYSTTQEIAGFVNYTSPLDRNLTTMVLNGRDAAQDPDGKIFEQILSMTQGYDYIHVVFRTERPVCPSCLRNIRDFLHQRPRAKIIVEGAVIP